MAENREQIFVIPSEPIDHLPVLVMAFEKRRKIDDFDEITVILDEERVIELSRLFQLKEEKTIPLLVENRSSKMVDQRSLQFDLDYVDADHLILRPRKALS